MEEKSERGESVVSVVSSVSSIQSNTTPINMKKLIIVKIKKDREVGPGGRKTSRDNSLLTDINPCNSPVVSNLQYSRRSPHNITHVSHTNTITPFTDAGESCGTCETTKPNEAAYGLPQCRSAGVIVRAVFSSSLKGHVL